MAGKNRNRQRSRSVSPRGTPRTRNGARTATAETPRPNRRWLWIGGGILVAVIAVAGAFAMLSGPSAAGAPTGTTPAAAAQSTIVQANGGHWTNITPDTLASMLTAKNFTLLNVKTPYMSEIDGTDLWIPYTDVAAQAATLPSDKNALIVVYCRSGNESAIAAQTLLDLGYTNIDNLDGGMTAWTASGRDLAQLNRQ